MVNLIAPITGLVVGDRRAVSPAKTAVAQALAPAVGLSIAPHAGPAAPAAGPIRLLAGGVTPLPPWAAGTRLVCTAGTVWVTRAGDAADHVLRPGDAFPLAGRGRVVVQALSDATIEVR